ncbi:hypothetical protein AGLY_001334 [Aphis glycines]|uniref:Uncharacterized protein n=1 Tax=Aphis glycines TaxID=307491 RepID=A0A6G0U4W2_APHGL|nr:hypothetical protein AGLY_001334 [Aphis glycines]
MCFRRLRQMYLFAIIDPSLKANRRQLLDSLWDQHKDYNKDTWKKRLMILSSLGNTITVQKNQKNIRNILVLTTYRWIKLMFVKLFQYNSRDKLLFNQKQIEQNLLRFLNSNIFKRLTRFSLYVPTINEKMHTRDSQLSRLIGFFSINEEYATKIVKVVSTVKCIGFNHINYDKENKLIKIYKKNLEILR